MSRNQWHIALHQHHFMSKGPMFFELQCIILPTALRSKAVKVLFSQASVILSTIVGCPGVCPGSVQWGSHTTGHPQTHHTHPWTYPLPNERKPGTWLMRGRYASCWNAFLFTHIFTKLSPYLVMTVQIILCYNELNYFGEDCAFRPIFVQLQVYKY